MNFKCFFLNPKFNLKFNLNSIFIFYFDCILLITGPETHMSARRQRPQPKGVSGDGTRTTTVERTARQEAQFSRKQGFARIDLGRQRSSWSRAAMRRVTRSPPPPLPSSLLLPSLCPVSDHKRHQAVSDSEIGAMVVDVQKSLQASASKIKEETTILRGSG